MYCTVNDLIDLISEERLIELTDDADTGAVDQNIVDKAITDAQSEIDSYLTRYPLPLAIVPNMVSKLCADIAVYNLFSRRTFDQMSENIDTRYKRAIDFLKSVASGRASLGIERSETQQSGGYVNENNQVFDRDKLKVF